MIKPIIKLDPNTQDPNIIELIIYMITDKLFVTYGIQNTKFIKMNHKYQGVTKYADHES